MKELYIILLWNDLPDVLLSEKRANQCVNYSATFVKCAGACIKQLAGCTGNGVFSFVAVGEGNRMAGDRVGDS